jgi:hypothetical protein
MLSLQFAKALERLRNAKPSSQAPQPQGNVKPSQAAQPQVEHQVEEAKCEQQAQKPLPNVSVVLQQIDAAMVCDSFLLTLASTKQLHSYYWQYESSINMKCC